MTMQRRAVLAAAASLAAPALAQPRRTATLRFVPQSSLPTLDPMFSSDVVMNHGFTVFDTLYAADSNGVPRPQMAAGHTVSDDGLVWRIRLREGLMFHDGTPVRAIDCATSLARWAKLDTFGLLLDDAVERWTAADDQTVEIHLTRRFPLLLDAIAKASPRVAFVMPEHLARTDPHTPIAAIVGSGPYRFRADEYVSGSLAVYQRFDRYQPRAEPPDWASGGKVAHFPRVEWRVLPDPAIAYAALRRGEVDWWELPLPDFYSSLASAADVTLQVDNPGGRVSFMRLNHLQPPFDDLSTRQAVRTAVAQADYMRAIFGNDAGAWQRCLSAFPCLTPYETADDTRLMPADLEAGRALLQRSAYHGQRAIILDPTDNPLLAPLGAVAADLLSKLGMNVELATSDWATVVQRRASHEPVERGGWSVLQAYGSAIAFANPAVNPLMRGAGLGGWFGWWDSPPAEALLQRWLAAPDVAARIAAGRALGRLALEQVATIPLGQWFGRTAYRNTITGVLPGGSPYPWNVQPT